MAFWSWTLYVNISCGVFLVACIIFFKYSRIGEVINWNYHSRRSIRKRAEALGCREPWTRPTYFFGLFDVRRRLKAQSEHRLLQHTLEIFKESGANTHSKFVLGRQVIVTVEPANIQTVLASDFHSFGLENLRRGFLPMLGPGIFSTDGAAWKHSRESLRPSFTRSCISDIQQFEKHVQNIIQRIPFDGQTIDLQPLFFDLAMDISTDFLFGESTNALAGETMRPDVAKFVQAWNDCSDDLSNSGGRRGLLGLFFEDPSFKRSCKTIHGLLENIKSPIVLRNECLNVLLAGRDTTSALLGNLFWIISHRSDIQSRLREEIAALPDPFSYEDLKNLKYVRAVINESLRLHPIVPSNFREALRDTTLPVGGGPDGKSPVFVTKGGLVSWNLYVMHRRKDIYGEDAEEFIPERWLDSEAVKPMRPGWGYLPFNGGPRICIGRKSSGPINWLALICPEQFAITETSYVLVRLIQEFSIIESRDPEPWTEQLMITLTSFNGAKLSMVRKS